MIPTLTYRTLSDLVKNYAKATCINITNFAGLPACYKAGYSWEVGSGGEGAGRMSSIANPIVQVAASTVDTDMTNFLNNIGVPASALDYPIDNANLDNFILDLIVFVSTKIGFAVSQSGNAASSASKYVVYMNNNGLDYTNIRKVAPKEEGKGAEYIYSGPEMQDIMNKFFNSVKKSVRMAPIKFTFTC